MNSHNNKKVKNISKYHQDVKVQRFNFRANVLAASMGKLLNKNIVRCLTLMAEGMRRVETVDKSPRMVNTVRIPILLTRKTTGMLKARAAIATDDVIHDLSSAENKSSVTH